MNELEKKLLELELSKRQIDAIATVAKGLLDFTALGLVQQSLQPERKPEQQQNNLLDLGQIAKLLGGGK